MPNGIEPDYEEEYMGEAASNVTPLTKQWLDKISHMQPGDEMDRLIAQEVLGWRELVYVRAYPYGHMSHTGWLGTSPEGRKAPMVYHFSTQHGDAMFVLNGLVHAENLSVVLRIDRDESICHLVSEDGKRIAIGKGPEFKLAVCRAILLWKLTISS